MMNATFAAGRPELFPTDEHGEAAADHIATLVNVAFDPQQMPDRPSIRDLERIRAEGESKYMYNRYLRERGDANIRTNMDLINKAKFYDDPRFPDRKQRRERDESAMELNTAQRLQQRFAVQQIVLQCMHEQRLDAVTYPTSNLPPKKLGAPSEPTLNGRGRSGVWTFLGQQGFPVITVPAGFTTQVYDRVENPEDKDNPTLVGPVAAQLPVGIDFLGRPFDEPKLLRIAAAYEAATHHRTPPPDFGPLADEQ